MTQEYNTSNLDPIGPCTNLATHGLRVLYVTVNHLSTGYAFDTLLVDVDGTLWPY